MCTNGCCEVGKYVYGENSTFFDDEEDEENNDEDIEIKHYPAYEAYFGDYGDNNYALPAYCLEKNHLECLKQISKEPKFMYHGDLAICAIESDNLEFLKFIVECLGDVSIDVKISDVGPNCLEYVKNLLKKYKKNKWIDKV